MALVLSNCTLSNSKQRQLETETETETEKVLRTTEIAALSNRRPLSWPPVKVQTTVPCFSALGDALEATQ